MTNIETRGIGAYRESDQTHNYEYDSGVVVLPLAGRTAAHRLIRLHGGIGVRTVNWSVARLGRPPLIPAMTDTRGDTFIGGSVVPELPVPSPSVPGQFDWRVSGEYRFVQNSPRIAGENSFPAGAHPFVVPGQNNAAVSPTARKLSLSTATTDSLVTALLTGVTMDPSGNFAWPFTVLPAAMTTDHMMGD